MSVGYSEGSVAKVCARVREVRVEADRTLVVAALTLPDGTDAGPEAPLLKVGADICGGSDGLAQGGRVVVPVVVLSVDESVSPKRLSVECRLPDGGAAKPRCRFVAAEQAFFRGEPPALPKPPAPPKPAIVLPPPPADVPVRDPKVVEALAASAEKPTRGRK
jgi:hypothetical protein